MRTKLFWIFVLLKCRTVFDCIPIFVVLSLFNFCTFFHHGIIKEISSKHNQSKNTPWVTRSKTAYSCWFSIPVFHRAGANGECELYDSHLLQVIYAHGTPAHWIIPYLHFPLWIKTEVKGFLRLTTLLRTFACWTMHTQWWKNYH